MFRRCPEHFLSSYFFNPKPNPYPFLDPGRVIPGNAGGPGPGRRAGSQNPNPLGGCAPQTPARVSSGRSGVQRHICYRHILLLLIQRHICLRLYVINLVNPVCICTFEVFVCEIELKNRESNKAVHCEYPPGINWNEIPAA